MMCLRRRTAKGLAVCTSGVLGAAFFAAFAAASHAAAPDWPQFRGPDRDGKCAETGLLKEWPKGGPKLLWKVSGLGRGFSDIAIVGGKFYTMGDRTPSGEDEGQFVLAFDLQSRKELWATRIGPPYAESGGGPRCTPTVDGELLYVVGTEGDLACLDAASGKIVWKKSFAKDFGGKMMSMWKYSESPLVDGEKLVCTPGGKQAMMVALDKKTGQLIWQCAVPPLGNRGKDGAGYASMIAAELDGVRQYVQTIGRGVIGVDAQTGKFLWGYNKIANNVANIPTSLARDGNVFVTTSYETGSALLKPAHGSDTWDAKEVYFLKYRDFENHHGGIVLVGDYVYGGSGRNSGALVCLDFKTGKIAWRQKPVGKGSAALLYADGHLIFRYEDGTMALVEANPKEFKLKGTFKTALVNGKSWPYPVIHDGKLYLRDQDDLMCYDIRQ